MKQLPAIALLAAGLILGGCSTSKNESDNETPMKSVASDTTDSLPPPPGPGLAPGTAKIRGTFIESTDSTRLDIKVEEVLGYGSATPPIAVGDTLTVRISAKAKHTLDYIRELTSFITIISHQQAPDLGRNNQRASWSMQNLSKEQ